MKYVGFLFDEIKWIYKKDFTKIFNINLLEIMPERFKSF